MQPPGLRSEAHAEILLRAEPLEVLLRIKISHQRRKKMLRAGAKQNENGM